MSKEDNNKGKKVGVLLLIVLGALLLLSVCEFVTCASNNPLPMWKKKVSNY